MTKNRTCNPVQQIFDIISSKILKYYSNLIKITLTVETTSLMFATNPHDKLKIVFAKQTQYRDNAKMGGHEIRLNRI